MSIIDIARSGILAYRTALAVTSENVANVNTEGYVRRDVTMEALGGARMTPSSGGTLGQGVWIDDVRRAFDSIASDRLRSSESALASASTQVTTGQAIEDTFLPGSAGIGAAMEEFFGAMGKLSAQPADIGLRNVVLREGAGAAASFADAATALDRLREDVTGQAALAAKDVSSALAELHSLNRQMVGLSSTPGAVNPIHDARDRVLSDLATKLEVNVTLDSIGRADIYLGPGPGGHRLLDIAGPATVMVANESPLSLSVAKDGATVDSSLLTGGALGGLANSLSALDATIAELDTLARRFVSDMNRAHAAGVDLDALSGAPLFELRGVEVSPALANRGTTAASLTGNTLSAPVSLVYDGTAAVWRALDDTGVELASGASRIDLPGLSVSLQGRAQDGDRFTLSPREGTARDMRFVLTNPRSLAAASPSVVAPLASNRGTASISIEPANLPPTGLAPLASLLGSSAADAITLLQPGVVGVIPAGSASANLYSLGRQATLDWMSSDADIALGGTLSFSVSGTPHSFAFPAGLNSADLAAGLTDGTILSSTGDTLAELGIQAGGVPGQFTLALGQGDFDAGATLSLASGPQSALTTAADPTASALQVFTRDGRQISGTPLTAAQATALLTQANGFLPGATYRMDTLNAAGGAGYRGTEVLRQTVPGAETLTLGLPGVLPNGAPMPSMPISVTYAGQTQTLTLAEGSSAKRAAAELSASLDGLKVEAQTHVALGPISDGQVSFRLAGDSPDGSQITATVSGGDLGALARAITLAGGATGISASVAPDGSRILLRHPTGEDIRLSNFSHSAGGTMSVAAAGAQGEALVAPTLLGGAVTQSQVTGQLQFTGAATIGVTLNSVFTASAPDAMAGSMLSREISEGGAVQALTFAADPMADAGGVAADGLSSFAASLSQTLTVNGTTVTVQGATTPAEVATRLTEALREVAPSSSMTGAAVGVLPADGLVTAISLDGQTYTLRMQSGAVVVEGPEAGRLTASFDAANQLQLQVTDGAPDGAGLTLIAGASNAAAFGIAQGQGAIQRLTGLPVVPGDLPPGGQILSVLVGGTQHDLVVRPSGPGIVVDLPPAFAGTATVLGDGSVALEVPESLGAMRVLPGAALAGFDVAGASAIVADGKLRLTSADGAPMDVTVAVASTVAERLTLDGLPNEDLIVAMTGPGALRLAGSITPQTGPTVARATELRVLDAATGQVELFDTQTGHSIASGQLDGRGQATLGGYRVTVTGQAMTGDGFMLTANTSPSGDSRALQALIALADANPVNGRGGFAKILAQMTSDIGSQVSASQTKETAMTSANDSLRRKVAEAGAVNLDAEAALLIELQQAYQASAQVMTIARQLFDTILNSL